MLLGLVKDPLPAASLSVSSSVSLIFLTDAVTSILHILPYLPPFLFPFQMSKNSLTSHLLFLTIIHFLSVQFKCVSTASLEWAPWWAPQITFLDMFNTQSWHCLTPSLPISMVVRLCQKNQLGRGSRLWSCDLSSSHGSVFLHSFGWIC